jgi:hypothetical protein
MGLLNDKGDAGSSLVRYVYSICKALNGFKTRIHSAHQM